MALSTSTAQRSTPSTASATSREAATLLAALLASGRTHEVEPALMSVRKRLRDIVAQLGIDAAPAPVASPPAPKPAPAPAPKRTTVARTTSATADADPETALIDILARKPTANVVARKMRAQNGAKFAYNAGRISLPEAEAIYAQAKTDADGAMRDLRWLLGETPDAPAPVVSAPARKSAPAREFVAVFEGTPARTTAPVAIAQELLDLA